MNSDLPTASTGLLVPHRRNITLFPPTTSKCNDV